MSGYYHYMSPEAVRGLPTGEAADVFTLCVMLCELVGGEHPLGVDATPRRFEPSLDVLERIRDMRYRIPYACGPFLDVIRRNLDRDPAHRMSLAELKEALLDAATRAGLDTGEHVIARLVAPGSDDADTVDLER
jgi:serine/threonine protein kinase